MKHVVTYARVSTDEQGRLGYSLQEQDHEFTHWAEKSGIEIVARFKDDASGKTMNRPGWIQLETFVKSNRQIDGIVVIVWDRFSRNTLDAHSVIEKYQKRGIEINAISQWIDFDIPEQEMMLAIYVSGAQIYNRRLSLRVTAGLRRAMKEGRWMGSAPIGYVNARDASGKPIIVPGDKASIMAELFRDYAKGIFTPEDMRDKYSKLGINRCKNAIADLLRNPVYIGKIKIKPWRSEPAQIVDGIHQPLIDEDTFNRVQAVLAGRKRAPYMSADESLPLRGFLICHQCGKKLTGSASRGNGGKYYYYHCQFECKERFRAKEANEAIERCLSSLTPEPEDMMLIKAVMADIFQDKEKSARRTKEQIHREMAAIQNDMTSLDEKFVKNQIGQDRYEKMNRMLDSQLALLKAKKIDAELLERDFMQALEFSFTLISRLDYYYKNADLAVKREIIGSIFPESLVYHDGKYRTIRNNELITVFGHISREGGRYSTSIEPKFTFSDQFVADVSLVGRLRTIIPLSYGGLLLP